MANECFANDDIGEPPEVRDWDEEDDDIHLVQSIGIGANKVDNVNACESKGKEDITCKRKKACERKEEEEKKKMTTEENESKRKRPSYKNKDRFKATRHAEWA
ncbi:hypothetical protein CDL15_Pgr010622 [Punica granatum]|uniref:Uncharacterized protein n=1 Tax=Punica granatum TaxID=22663 RepID=A0A218VTI1_PUNGR|nr:hypothetical protein CDL15_Pgr010622 [Punica granatum]